MPSLTPLPVPDGPVRKLFVHPSGFVPNGTKRSGRPDAGIQLTRERWMPSITELATAVAPIVDLAAGLVQLAALVTKLAGDRTVRCRGYHPPRGRPRE